MSNFRGSVQNITYDSLVTEYTLKDVTFETFARTYEKQTEHPFEEKLLSSFSLVTEDGFLTNAGVLFSDQCPYRHSSLYCTRWTGLHKDDAKDSNEEETTKFTLKQCFTYKQTWAFAFGKFMTDGVWWFYLFWTPAYLSSVYKMDSTQSAFPLFVLYIITLLSIIGGWLPKYFVDKLKLNPYSGRMKAMLIFAFFPLLALFAQPGGEITYWIPVIIIGIAGAAHQAWSANIFSTVGDMFPKKAIATVTGIGGMAGGIGSFIINKGSGVLFDYAHKTWTTVDGIPLLQKFPKFATERIPDHFFEDLQKSGAVISDGINKGYMIIFSICAVTYLIAWFVMKSLVPKYQVIK